MSRISVVLLFLFILFIIGFASFKLMKDSEVRKECETVCSHHDMLTIRGKWKFLGADACICGTTICSPDSGCWDEYRTIQIRESDFNVNYQK